MADAAVEGGGVSMAAAQFLVDVLADGQVPSEFGPYIDVLQEGPFGIDVEAWIEAVTLGFYVETDDPHRVYEVG